MHCGHPLQIFFQISDQYIIFKNLKNNERFGTCTILDFSTGASAENSCLDCLASARHSSRSCEVKVWQAWLVLENLYEFLMSNYFFGNRIKSRALPSAMRLFLRDISGGSGMRWSRWTGVRFLEEWTKVNSGLTFGNATFMSHLSHLIWALKGQYLVIDWWYRDTISYIVTMVIILVYHMVTHVGTTDVRYMHVHADICSWDMVNLGKQC